MDGGDPRGRSFGELMAQPDILIIGGGVIGSAAAFFLTGSGKAGKVTVLEPDPLYSKAATPRASGGARRLFSRPENIEMSNYSIPFYENFSEHCTVDGEPPEIGFKRDGYLFIVPPEGIDIIERNHALQTSLGVKVDLLDRDALQRRFPGMNVSDIGAASHAPEDGCLEPNGALQGFRRKARSQGAEYLAERVVAMTAEGTSVRTVTLSNGEILRPRHVICAAGTWSADIAAMVGMMLPVEPMQRHDHFWECRAEMERLPFVKDLNGLGFHNWDRGYAGSVVDFGIPAGENWEVDHDYFQRIVWPHIAHRFPIMEELKLRDSWVGHYDRNRLDGNMILGNWPGKLDNFFVACGFSGHGLMHAPAVGRALSELVLHGEYRTLDLTRMGYRRVLDNEPYAESGIR
jgi:FAD-dependent oxidoreductase domain-containing protein 1